MNNKISKITIALIISLLVIGVLFAQEIGIKIISNGNVGIGTANPTAELEVNGRIKDKSGFIMPVGTILPYGGNTAPEGWLLCDGSGISRVDYTDLFDAIGTNFGEGDGSTTFNIPDLRGIFLRGAGASGQLTDANGNSFSATLGEYQNDAFQGHYHTFEWKNCNRADGGNDTSHPHSENNRSDNDKCKAPVTDGTNGVPRTAAETRPANLGVNYIIKY